MSEGSTRLAGLPTGLHLADVAMVEPIIMEASRLGLFVGKIGLRDCQDKASLLQVFAKALSFPDWFGDNWDAFADCLADLDWLESSGHVLVIELGGPLATGFLQELETCREILAETVVERGKHGLPMWVLWCSPSTA